MESSAKLHMVSEVVMAEIHLQPPGALTLQTGWYAAVHEHQYVLKWVHKGALEWTEEARC